MAAKSDILRFELLYGYGGVYIDTDFECLQPLDGVLTGLSGFAARERTEGWLNHAIMGATQGHPFFRFWLDKIPSGPAFTGDKLREAGPRRTGQLLQEWLAQSPVGLRMEDAVAGRDSGVLYRDRFAVFEPCGWHRGMIAALRIGKRRPAPHSKACGQPSCAPPGPGLPHPNRRVSF